MARLHKGIAWLPPQILINLCGLQHDLQKVHDFQAAGVSWVHRPLGRCPYGRGRGCPSPTAANSMEYVGNKPRASCFSLLFDVHSRRGGARPLQENWRVGMASTGV